MADNKVLWRVPIYSIIAGLITFRLNIFLFSKFAVSNCLMERLFLMKQLLL